MWFDHFARGLSEIAGRPGIFFLAVGSILFWAALGPMASFSETWQLIVNTGTTIVTFLMVFLIQNAQNRDTMAIQLKLDELLRAMKTAKNELIDLEHASDAEVKKLQDRFSALAEKARNEPTAGTKNGMRQPSPAEAN